jgi:predicted dehydrogenase
MRFWPGWDWLKARVSEGTYGKVVSAVFTRVGSRPEWSREFYHDPERTGGAMFDLHVHDAYEFGPPTGGPRHVSAEGAWVGSRGFPFRMRYTVEFEGAVADWDLSRDPQLILVRDGKAEGVALSGASAYDEEVAHFVSTVASGGETRATMKDAVMVTRLLEAEKKSLDVVRSVGV